LRKPEVDLIEGLSPAVAIDQRGVSGNPRSTVGTLTEIYDFLRLLFARLGTPHCPVCGREVQRQSAQEIVAAVAALPSGTRFVLLAPLVRARKGVHHAAIDEIRQSGFVRMRLDGTLYDEARASGFRFPETLDGWLSNDWRQFALRRDPHTPWLRAGWRARVRNFESVLNAYYPTVTDIRLTPLRRAALRLLAGWRYRLEWYALPLELRTVNRLFGYQRPETTGF
jgi:hypothetical protein